MRLDKDDPRIIDFALGELDADEHQAIAAALESEENTAAKEVLEEFQQVIESAATDLAQEEDVALGAGQREEILSQAQDDQRPERSLGWLIPLMAAAGILMIFASIIVPNMAASLRSDDRLAQRPEGVTAKEGIPAELQDQLEALGYLGEDVPETSAPSSERDRAATDLLDDAKRYEEASYYDVAQDIYEQVLLIDPENQDAQEGLREATVHAKEQASAAAQNTTPKARSQIREMVEIKKQLPDGANVDGMKPVQFKTPVLEEVPFLTRSEETEPNNLSPSDIPTMTVTDNMVDILVDPGPLASTASVGTPGSDANKTTSTKNARTTESPWSQLQEITAGMELEDVTPETVEKIEALGFEYRDDGSINYSQMDAEEMHFYRSHADEDLAEIVGDTDSVGMVPQPYIEANEMWGEPAQNPPPSTLPPPKPKSSLQNVEIGGSIRIRGNYYDFDDDRTRQSAQYAAKAPYSPAPASKNLNYYAELDAIGYVDSDGDGISLNDLSSVSFRPHPRNTWEYPTSTEQYALIQENTFKRVTDAPLSTFSVDVDTASYSNVRRFLTQRQFPPPNAVRIEELLNYFDYDYPQPEGDTPFAVAVTAGPCPWRPGHTLAKIGLQGRAMPVSERPRGNFVFLLDVSGSMDRSNKLPLVKESMRALLQALRPDDRVGIVTYASNAAVHLRSTTCDEKEDIERAIESLSAGGSTHGSAGIHDAYKMARRYFVEGGVNRVILATDGDFNVGTTDHEQLMQLIEREAKSNVFLTALGFGMGNIKDHTLEQLADRGNGHYAYIDDFKEARKVLVEQLNGALVTIAKDVKIQVEFNPAQVGAYRLIGYENRVLAAQDFNDDTKDAGEIGAGHTVTALYEVVPPGASPAPGVDPLKYQDTPTPPVTETPHSDELMTVKLRWKKPEGDTSAKIEVPVRTVERRTKDLDFAASVASFGMLLRGSQYGGSADWTLVRDLAESGQNDDEERREFLDLVVKAKTMANQ